MEYFIRFAVIAALILLTATASVAVAGSDVKSLVESRYRITRPGFFGNYSEIGSVLVVRKDGLRAGRPGKLFKPNLVRNGQLEVVGGGDVPLGNNIDGFLKTGDRLHLYGVTAGDDYVELTLFTVKHFVITGMKGSTPLQASLRFQYDRGVTGASAKQIMEDIGAWIQIEREPVTHGDQGGGETPGAGNEVSVIKTIRITGPEGAAKPTRTIQLGQTAEEVAAILGGPEKKILLGTKTVFVYKDVKVVFIDGKLADAY